MSARLFFAAFAAVLALTTSFVAGCGDVKRPDGGVGLLAVGDVAPDLSGENATGDVVRLSGVRGHPAIVFFYPKDESPGCTKEACAFRDGFARFEKEGVVLFGVSRDSTETHRAFAANHKLPFPLVADESAEIEHAYGVSNKLGLTARVTFLVGGDGRIARVWPDVDPAIHADEVLAAATALPAARSAHSPPMPPSVPASPQPQ